MDLSRFEKDADQSERKEPPVRLRQSLIEIRKGQRESDRLSVDFREKDEPGIDYLLERGSHVIDLGVGHGDESPVLFPRAIVDVAHQLHFLVKPFLLEEPHLDAAAGRQALRQAQHPLGRHVVLQIEGEQILRLGEALTLQMIRIVGRVVRHQNHRSGIESVDQESELFVAGKARGTAHALHPPLPQPFRSGLEEPGRDQWIRHRFVKAEEPGLLLMNLVVQMVDDRGDPPHGLTRTAVPP